MDKTSFFITSSESRDLRKIVLKLCLFLPLLTGVVLVNYFIDPLNYFKTGSGNRQADEFKIAQGLAGGKTVELRQEINDRLLQKYLIELQPSAPDTIILGSSRSMQVGSWLQPGQRVINNSVFIAKQEDYLGLYFNYVRHDREPRRVVLALEPQTLNGAVDFSFIGFKDWESLEQDVNGMLRLLGMSPVRYGQTPWSNILSFGYFQQSARRGFHQWKRDSVYNILDKESSQGMRFLPDGRRVRPVDTRRLSSRELQRNLASRVDRLIVTQLLKTRPETRYKSMLENFIVYLLNQKVQVVLLLVPYHPLVYQEMTTSCQSRGMPDMVGLENYYRSLAVRFKLPLIGSYDPANCHVLDEDFSDGIHLNEFGMRKLFGQVQGSQEL